MAPSRITVTAGTKVTFTNNGVTPHNAASSDGGGWDTGLLAQGRKRERHVQSSPGPTHIICTPHPSMIGQIIVTGQAVAAAPATVVRQPGPRPPGSPAPAPDHGAH